MGGDDRQVDVTLDGDDCVLSFNCNELISSGGGDGISRGSGMGLSSSIGAMGAASLTIGKDDVSGGDEGFSA